MKSSTHLLSAACGLALSTLTLGSCTTSDTVDGTNSTSTTTAPGNGQPVVTDRDVSTEMDNGTRTSTPIGTIDGSPDLPDGRNKTAPVEPVRTMHNNANIGNNRDVTTPGTGTPVR